MKLPDLPDWVVLALYEQWSEDTYRAVFHVPDAEKVAAFREDIARAIAAGQPQEDYEVDMLRLYREQEASVPE